MPVKFYTDYDVLSASQRFVFEVGKQLLMEKYPSALANEMQKAMLDFIHNDPATQQIIRDRVTRLLEDVSLLDVVKAAVRQAINEGVEAVGSEAEDSGADSKL